MCLAWLCVMPHMHRCTVAIIRWSILARLCLLIMLWFGPVAVEVATLLSARALV